VNETKIPSTTSRRTVKRFGSIARLLAIFCATALGFQANVATALPALYVHYDASDAANVTVDGSDVVTSLTDLSAPTTTAYDATKVGGAGTLFYSDPGNLSPTGLKGVDTNNGPHNKLLVLSNAEQEALLNFPGAASSKTGFAALVVFKADIVAGSTRNLVLASHGNASTSPGSFIMKYENGVPQVVLGGTSVKASATAVVADGETVVLAVNYNQATGNMEVWDSENNTSASVTKAAADFSSTQSLYLAGSANGGQGMDGMIGEVKIFEGVLTSAEFAAEQTALVNKWLGAPPLVTYAHYDASDASTVGFDAVNTSKVITLDDLSANNLGAEDGNGTQFGDVLYPDAIQSLTGLDLLDMGAGRNTLRTLLPNTEQRNLLDFTPSTGLADGNSGFSFFVVARVDSILAGNVNAILGNNSDPSSGSLMLRLDGTGNAPRLMIGNQDSGSAGAGSTSVIIENTGAGIGAGDIVVIAANYDKATGDLEFWNSKAGASVTGTVPAGDFSNTEVSGSALFIGGTNSSAQFMDGAIGEVKFYDFKLTAEQFAAEQTALVEKWIGDPGPAGLTAIDGNEQVTLEWDDVATATYTAYRSLAAVGGYSAVSGVLTDSNYTDTTVSNDTTYYYYVTATVTGGSESSPSNTVSANPFAPITGNTLYAHYDATDADSISFETATEVSVWADQTANAFDAAAVIGADPILYPSGSVTSYGINGLDIPETAQSKLLAFTPAQQDQWLDFSSGGAAQVYSGFTIFAVVKPDAVGVTSDVVFANHGNSGDVAESLSLRYTDGKPRIYLGGTDWNLPIDPEVAAGETVVLAVKYDSGTGELKLYDSESGLTGTATVTATNDFSSVQNMYIAGDLNPGHGMDGLFGELKVYRGVMTDEEFEAERDALMAKWVQNAPVDVTAGADASDITLAWVDPNPIASLTYSVYRSEVSGTYGSALASGFPSTNYTDSTAIFGTTYYYVVTATRDGIESGFSAEVFEATTAASALYGHYDASDAANVTLENTNEVTDFADLSGNNYNADVGSLTAVLYPDATQSATGLDLLDMGETNNRLRTLLSSEQDALLNFAPDTGEGAGEAASNSGFSFFAVARVDALFATDSIIRDVVLGNAGNTAAGLVLKFQGGSPKLYVGGVEAEGPSVVPEAGDTLVFAANYNNVTQQLEFWNSKANSSVTVTVPAADFSTGAAIFIGGSNNPDQYMDGAIGEVKFYQGRMSPAAFAAEQLALTEKWITGSPSTDFTSWVDSIFADGTLSDKTAAGDDDNDGISNLIEFAIEGQDPTVSNSAVGTHSGLVVTFLKRQEVPAVGGITYVIEQSTDLGVTDTWAAVTPTVDDVNSISYTLPGDEAKDFVRLKVTQD
jgi:fibronectin type 3 domain-containing protein